MYFARFKTALVAMTILVALMFSTVLFADCDIMGMISKYGYTLSQYTIPSGTYEYPQHYIEFLMTRSTNIGEKPNPNGYGLIYYPKGIHELHYSPNLYDFNNNCWYLVDEGVNGDDYYHGNIYTG